MPAAPSPSSRAGAFLAETRAQALGRKLLRDIFGIGEQAFANLVDAMEQGREGETAALLQRMNESIATHLFPQRWWNQDRDFELRLGPRSTSSLSAAERARRPKV